MPAPSATTEQRAVPARSRPDTDRRPVFPEVMDDMTERMIKFLLWEPEAQERPRRGQIGELPPLCTCLVEGTHMSPSCCIAASKAFLQRWLSAPREGTEERATQQSKFTWAMASSVGSAPVFTRSTARTRC